MLTDYFFWFAQPATQLNNYDWAAAYIFAGLLVLSILGGLVNKFFIKHPIVKKLVSKWTAALLWTGIIGLIWFGFRFQAIPIFSKRFWAGAIMVMGLVWLGFVKWYLVKHFFGEKRDYDYNAVKSKYIR
jgi:cellulose synthase/poly-beta-1,6-N-acetylglucosamine synthase-like glycosyltransferase